jgi:hypothetical protein
MANEVDLLKLQTDLLTKKQDLERESNKDTQEYKDKLATIELALDQINQKLSTSKELQEARINQLKVELELLKQSDDFLKQKGEGLDSLIRQSQIQLEIEEEGLRTLRERIKEEIKKSGTDSQETKNLIKDLSNETIKVEKRKEQVEIGKKLGDQTKQLSASMFGISSNWKETYWGKLDQLTGKDGLPGKGAILATSFKDIFSLSNLAGSFVMGIIEQTAKAFKEYDQAAASLAKVAGSNEQLQSVLSNTARGATAYGISFAQAGKAIEGLYSELNTFSNLSQKAQEQIVVSTAKLEKLGISSQQSAKQIATLTQIMGITEVQAAKTAEELGGFALAIGRSPQQVASDFAAASDKLGAYGGKMIEVFKNLETQAKGTGVAVNDLLRIAEKFQTFEGAAQSAGKLNAALGGGFVNAMELLEASAEDPTKAIDLLRSRLNDAGLAFNQLSFYEQKLIADAGGFKSVEEASRILSMTNAEAERAAQADAERAAEQQLLNDAIQRSIPIQEKLQLILANLAITVGPFVEAISTVISLIARFVDSAAGKFVIWVGALVAAFVAGPIVAFVAGLYALIQALMFLHDVLFVPNSPILFDSLVAMSTIFNDIADGVGNLFSSITSTSKNFDSFATSAKGIASSFETLPDSISVTTPQLDKLNTSMEVTNKITDATKRSVDSINNLNTDKANTLVNIMSPQQPNVTVSPTINQPPTQVAVYLGNEPIKGIVNKVINGGSNLPASVLSTPSTTRGA